MQSRAFNRVRAVRFGEKQAAVREDSCYFAGGPIGYCIGRYCRKADNESLAERCEGSPAGARFVRPHRQEMGSASAQKAVTLAASIQEALPGSATPGGSSLPPALGSKLLTSGGVDGRALRAAHCD